MMINLELVLWVVKMTSDGVVCRRCGQCCYLVIDGKLSSKPCKFLVPIGNNRFACRIYFAENRLGHDIGFGNRCNRRCDVPVNYPSCPYNRKEWGVSLMVGDCVVEKS